MDPSDEHCVPRNALTSLPQFGREAADEERPRCLAHEERSGIARKNHSSLAPEEQSRGFGHNSENIKTLQDRPR
jgi:hypothetical protein